MIRKGLILVGLFLLCFLAPLFLRGNGGLSRFFQKPPEIEGPATHYEPEEYDLAEKSVVTDDAVSLLSRMDKERIHLIRKVTPSVVCISTEGLQRQRLLGRSGQATEQLKAVKDVGSGVIVSEQGHLVTNHHVVAGKIRFVVTTHNGREYNARLIGTDPIVDIAVLKIESEEERFSPLPFGDSDSVMVGQSVFAVGNPFGLGETVTQGIISAKERSFSDRQRDLFQSDAPINPGNSGGPLINVSGEIVGINVAIFNTEGNQQSSQGLGFSIPANDVLRTFQQIAERGRPIHGYLGVELMDISPEIKVYLDYKGDGVAVTGVTKGSPAQRAGLLPRDVIVKYNDTKVANKGHMIRLIENSPVTEALEIVIEREGSRMKLNALIIDKVERGDAIQETIKDGRYKQVMGRLASIGLKVRELEWIERRRGGGQGVMVAGIQPNSMAHKTGLRKGDRVISMNGDVLSSAEQFYQFINDAQVGEQMMMIVQRGNQRVQLKFSLR